MSAIPMTKLDGVPDADTAKPGMAFFSGTGPFDKKCGDCKLRGYLRESRKGRWDDKTNQIVHRVYRVQACQMFKKLTGINGPKVEKEWSACKYFEQKAKR